MKSARILFFALIIAAMLLSIVACISGGGGDGGGGTSQPEALRGEDATATYGADMFHLQLTAMARDQATPAAQAP